MSIAIVYPEKRVVSDSKIMTWASDAVANGEIDACDVDLEDAYDCAKALHDIGFITLANREGQR